MKTYILILMAGMLTFPAFAEQTNELHKARGEKKLDGKKGGRHDSGREKKYDRENMTPEQKEKMQAHRLQLMEKSLNDIGVSEEQRQQIAALQQSHREKMRAVSVKTDEARKNLSALQDAGASEAELDAAINTVTEAQSDQLKLLVRNRMEMEKILGKEKYAQFMESARQQFRKHGRRGGSGMPPRPPSAGQEGDTPPVPKQTPPTP